MKKFMLLLGVVLSLGTLVVEAALQSGALSWKSNWQACGRRSTGSLTA